jgi:hypothetical protein
MNSTFAPQALHGHNAARNKITHPMVKALLTSVFKRQAPGKNDKADEDGDQRDIQMT